MNTKKYQRKKETKKQYGKNCNSLIVGKYNYQRKYCSSRCAYELNREKLIERAKKRYQEKIVPTKIYFKPYLIPCKSCNLPFEKRCVQQVYCSKECQEKDYTFKGLLKIRFEIFKRDNFQCQYCGRTPKKDRCKLIIEHIIPRAKGGDNSTNNLTTSCVECNLGKSDVLLEERKLKKEDKLNVKP